MSYKVLDCVLKGSPLTVKFQKLNEIKIKIKATLSKRDKTRHQCFSK